MSGELAIRLRGVVMRYGPITAVNGLDLEVPEGTCVDLLGPNGAGKSTTMRLLTAQSIADEGELEVLGFRLPNVRTSAPGSGCRRFVGILAARRKAVRVHPHEKAYDPGSPCF
jgi:ABC-type multidrug transport system ATPase subunit